MTHRCTLHKFGDCTSAPQAISRRQTVRGLAILGAVMVALRAAPSLGAPEGPYCQPALHPDVFVLIDRTSVFTSQDRLIVREAMQKILRGLAVGQRLQIATIRGTLDREVLFDECVPGCNESGWRRYFSACNKWVAPDDLHAMERQLNDILDTLLETREEHGRSEIFSTIATTASARRSETPGELIVIGDLIENSAHVPSSMFLSTNRAREVEAAWEALGLLADFTGWKVRLVGIGRHQDRAYGELPIATQRHIRAMYQSYFSRCGASRLGIGATYDLARPATSR